MGSKKSTTNQTQNQTTQMTTTPSNPAWVDGGLSGMGDYLSSLMKGDPSRFIAGADPLQTQAAGSAARLGRFGAPGNESGYGQPQTSPGVSDPYGSAMSTFGRLQNGGANTYNPVTGQAQGYTARTGNANHYDATTGQAKTYDATTGQAQRYDATTGQAQRYDAATVADNPQVQSQSLLDNLGSYMSPYTNDVVNASLADYDYGAGQNEGQAKLDMAGDSTFGGSGGAIGLAALREGQSRGRGTLSAGLRDQAFQTGANLSNLDAGRRQTTSSENAYNSLQRLLANQTATNNASHDNTLAANNFGLANMEATNTASANNTLAANNFGLANMDAVNNASRDNTLAANNYGLANLDAVNNAAATNTQADNSYGLANLGAENQALANNTLAANNFGLANMDAVNKGASFNAGQQDTAAQRQMDAAKGLVGTANDVQSNDRSNIDTQSQIGQILQALSQQQAGAPLAFGAGMTSMWNGLPLDLLHGTTANGTMTGSGTSTGKESGAGLSDWLSYFSSMAQAASKGG